jgi:MFS family permease
MAALVHDSGRFRSDAYQGAIAVALPKMVFVVFGSRPWLLAAITTAIGLGAIVGAVFVGQVHLRRRSIIGLLGYILSGCGLMAFSIPLSHAIVPFMIIPAAFIAGFGINVMQIIWVTLLYGIVPSNKLGRVSSVDLLGSLGLLPIGFALAGWLSDRLGPPAVFVLGGLIIVILNVMPLFLRGIREVE